MRPILKYFSGIWGADQYNEMNKIYKRAIRYEHKGIRLRGNNRLDAS